jgi:hypothetical protein
MSKQIQGKVVEEFGLKANKKGFFKEWRTRTSSLSQEKNLPLHEAAEKAYYDLKFQGSE